jgi:hypothetical protein
LTSFYLRESTEGVDTVTGMTVNTNQLADLNAEFSIYMTIFIGFVMVVGAFIFTTDAERLVLVPIERMMNMVRYVQQ